MNKVLKTGLAAISSAAILATATACGSKMTVFDEMQKVLSVESGDFSTQLTFNMDDSMSVGVTGSGKYTSDAFEFNLEKVEVAADSVSQAFSNITVVFVDNTLYVPVSSVTGLVQSIMGSGEADSTITIEGQEYEWIGIQADTLVDTASSMGTTPDINTDSIDPAALKAYLVDTVIPALNRNFGSLESKILYTDKVGSHFDMDNDNAVAVLQALKGCIENGDFEKVIVDGAKLLGTDIEGSFDKEEVLKDIDTWVEGINQSEIKYALDLYSNSKSGTVGADVNIKDSEHDCDVNFVWTVKASDVKISAPENAYVATDIMSLFSSFTTPSLDSSFGFDMSDAYDFDASDYSSLYEGADISFG